MTSATFSNRTRVINFFTHTLKKQTPVTLLFTAFCLILCPGMLLENIFNSSLRGSNINIISEFILYSEAIFILSLILMLILTIQNFGFLFSKKTGDVFHALPLRRNELLFSNILATFVGSAFTMTAGYLSLSVVNFLPQVISIPFSTVILEYIVMLLMLFLCTVFTALFAVCSGGIFDFIVALGGINLGIPAIYFIFENFLSDNARGVRLNLFENGLKYTSPYLFSAVNVMKVAESGAKSVAEHFWSARGQVNFVSTIIFFVFTAICVFGISKLFYIRKSETAGEAYSFSLLPHIISVLVSIVGGYVIGAVFTGDNFDSLGFWFFFVIGIVLCSISAGAIFTRGFRTVKVSLIRAAVSTGLSILLCILTIYASGYITDYIPKENEIAEVTVGYNEETVFKKDFDIVLDIHKAALEKKKSGVQEIIDKTEAGKNNVTIVNCFDSIRINYYLKNGSIASREYYGLHGKEFEPLFIRYFRSDEYLERYKTFKPKDEGIQVQFTKWNSDKLKFEKTGYGMIFFEEAKAIMQSYIEEVKAAPDSAMYEDCDVLSIWDFTNNDTGGEIYLPKSFVKTRTLIEKVNFVFEEPDVESATDMQ